MTKNIECLPEFIFGKKKAEEIKQNTIDRA